MEVCHKGLHTQPRGRIQVIEQGPHRGKVVTTHGNKDVFGGVEDESTVLLLLIFSTARPTIVTTRKHEIVDANCACSYVNPQQL